jgi:hypothetical protein
VITLRYENVPHFCFTCGRIGHGAMKCEEGELVDQGTRFGQELRASPPRRVQQISAKQLITRVSRSLFQVGAHTPVPVATSSQAESVAQNRDDKDATSQRADLYQEHQDENRNAEGFQKFIFTELVDSVKEMNVDCKLAKASGQGERACVLRYKHDNG